MNSAKLKNKHYIKKAFLLLALPFVMWLSFSHVAFWHSHVLENGIVIQHSHPLNGFPAPGTPFQQHSHTDLELIILSQIGHFTGVLIFLLLLGSIYLKIIEKYNGSKSIGFLKPIYLYGSYLRGPPH